MQKKFQSLEGMFDLDKRLDQVKDSQHSYTTIGMIDKIARSLLDRRYTFRYPTIGMIDKIAECVSG